MFVESQKDETFLRSVLSGMETVYLNRNPTAKAVLELVKSVDGERICYDHFAFRTFGVCICIYNNNNNNNNNLLISS